MRRAAVCSTRWLCRTQPLIVKDILCGPRGRKSFANRAHKNSCDSRRFECVCITIDCVTGMTTMQVRSDVSVLAMPKLGHTIITAMVLPRRGTTPLVSAGVGEEGNGFDHANDFTDVLCLGPAELAAQHEREAFAGEHSVRRYQWRFAAGRFGLPKLVVLTETPTRHSKLVAAGS